jgi:hypothetical protein
MYVRGLRSVDNYGTAASVFKAKSEKKNTICVMWVRESARGSERNGGNK